MVLVDQGFTPKPKRPIFTSRSYSLLVQKRKRNFRVPDVLWPDSGPIERHLSTGESIASTCRQRITIPITLAIRIAIDVGSGTPLVAGAGPIS